MGTFGMKADRAVGAMLQVLFFEVHVVERSDCRAVQKLDLLALLAESKGREKKRLRGGGS